MQSAAVIFSHSITPRLRYIVDFLERYYGLHFRLTSDEVQYLNDPHVCRINYGYHRIHPDEIFIHSHPLLSESSIRPVKTVCFSHESAATNGIAYPCFFQTEGSLKFDLFAAVFYLVSRYEEYLPFHPDDYGRYPHTESCAFKNGFLHSPLVNIWLEEFRVMLAVSNPEFAEVKRSYREINSFDIDIAWCYRNKGLRRNLAGGVAHLFKGSFSLVAERIKVLRGRLKDPFDHYQAIRSYENVMYFVLAAPSRGQYDKNIDPRNPEFRELVRTFEPLGLHPSWASGDHPQQLTVEKKLLEEISGKPITASRQHFLRFTLPRTYQLLLEAGIRQEYSMGYGMVNGFRASVATPFLWYDLKKEEQTELMVHPFGFMDSTSIFSLKQDREAMLAEQRRLADAVKAVHGEMINVWHNHLM